MPEDWQNNSQCPFAGRVSILPKNGYPPAALRSGRGRVRGNDVPLVITQIPFSINTTTLIDSILVPMIKGKSNQKIEDNNAADVEI
jgi:hypothetical protein